MAGYNPPTSAQANDRALYPIKVKEYNSKGTVANCMNLEEARMVAAEHKLRTGVRIAIISRDGGKFIEEL